MAQNSELCITFMNCTPKAFDADGTRTDAPILFEVPCISSESVEATQNKQTDPTCRSITVQTETVESTSFSGNFQLEKKDPLSRLLACILFEKACDCKNVEFFFLEAMDDAALEAYEANPAAIFVADDFKGNTICGAPDVSSTRDQGTGKNISVTVTPTDSDNPPKKWSDWIEDVAGETVVDAPPTDL